MTGTWLIRIGHRLVDDDVFAMVVEPAIADLQFESVHSSAFGVLRGYVGVWKAIAGGITREIGGDLRLLSDDTSTLAGLVLLQACYYGFLATFLLNLLRHR